MGNQQHKSAIRLTIGLTLLLFCCGLCQAQRIRQSINTGWKFYKGTGDPIKDNSLQWESVSIPHSYNADDVSDDASGYYRGNAWYSKKLFIPKGGKNMPWYLFFEGVNQIATVYVNGKLAREHIGGYTAFRVQLNEFLNGDSTTDEIVVRVNNEFNPDIPPLTADFTFFGGIYRDVYLESVNDVHFNMDDYASDGIYVTTPQVSEERASVNLSGTLESFATIGKSVTLVARLFSPDRKLIATQQSKVLQIKPNQKIVFNPIQLNVSEPKLWSPENPHLYQLVTQIIDAKTKLLIDELSHPVGFRWFSFTGDKGFFLNGRSYKIWGTSRHQDYPGMGNALPDAIHVSDVGLLKEMGGNFLRIAHYPQDPAILEECDRLGILTSVEIPVVNTITESARFTENAVYMLKEMIRQNFNHPSVVMWAYMNEVLLRLPFNDDKPRQEGYFKNVNKLATTLDSLTRKEDPSRVTMMAFHGNYGLYKRTGLIDIPMVAGWNLYQGWYSDNIQGFATFLDDYHKDFPNTPMLVTEYGADGDPRVRSFSPVRFDKSVEYETYYHQVYCKAMTERPFVSGGLIWNLCDFSSETRAESMPHVNNKGIVDLYRTPKDAYYLYQAFLAKKPFLKIGSAQWSLRTGTSVSDDSLFCYQTVDIYTNLKTPIKLLNNGKLISTRNASEGVVSFVVPFSHGTNYLEAVSDDKIHDAAKIEFLLLPGNLRSQVLPFESINITLGDQRFIVNEKLHEVWVPEKQYEQGSWGYIGGRSFVLENKRQPFGSDKNILGTDNDPMYETQRIGLDEFRLDVPDGLYEITFHFAELTGGKKKETLVYNLTGSEAANAESAGERAFNIFVNGQLICEELSNSSQLIPEVAVSFKTNEVVIGGEGIIIKFKALQGETILNGLQVRKVY